MAFRAGKDALVLGMGIDLIPPIGLFNHFFVPAVAVYADIEVAGLLDLMVRGVAGLALHAAGDVAVGEEFAGLGGCRRGGSLRRGGIGSLHGRREGEAEKRRAEEGEFCRGHRNSFSKAVH